MNILWMPFVLVLVILVLLALVRLYLGPTAGDRAVSVDTVNTLVVAILILIGVYFKEVIYIDVAIVFALLSFVGTLFVAKYLGGDL